MPSRYAALTRAELATLVPELLLCGHLIDRSGMAWAIGEFGREGMLEVAIEEWAASSPIYTKRMQRALNFVGDDVITIFKGLQLDIGAPPQFMDFRYRVNSPTDGEFWLDHCGALLDVEPMGKDYVVGMCHAIEDPTFDATASATNPKAQMRPIHRPPRQPADRHPHCHWTVQIDPSYPDAKPIPLLAEIAATRAASLELAPIDAADDGAGDYAGPLLSDVDFGAFSKSALTRIAEEVCLQQHLLNLAFSASVRQRVTDVERAREIGTKQLTGIAAIAAERIARAMRIEQSPEGAILALAVHPVFNPQQYVGATFAGDTIAVRRSPAHDDGAWLDLVGPHSPGPLQAMVRAIDARYDVDITGEPDEWRATVVVRDVPAPEAPEVQVARFSGGTTFAFEPRTSLPLTVAGGSKN